MRTCGCQCTRIHASSSGSWWGGRCTCSRYFALAFPRLRKFLPGSWLLCQRFYTGWGYDLVATWPTGCFRHSHASRFSLLWGQCSNSAGASGLLSIGRSLRWFRLSRWYIWESSWTHCFRGFSRPEESREASLHWRRILVLRQSASVIWAGVIRGAVLNVPTCSWGSPPQFASGLWAPEDVERSINARELLAIESALKWFAPLLAGSSVAVFADKSTAVSYLRNQAGTRSSFLNSVAQRILRWVEDLSVVISPQVIMGKHNVLADALSRPNQVLGSEWTLKQEVFRDLCRRWLVSVGLFATSQNHSSLYFSPYHNHNAMGTDALLRNWNEWQAYAFPPWSLIPAGLRKLRSSSGVLLTIVAPYWPQRPWFPDLLDLVVDGPVALPQSRDLLRQLHFHRFHLGVSRLCLHAWWLSSGSPAQVDSPGV